ncbi:hypothetical protein F2Q69_00034449 [Brassica cretica]|uniref:Alfin N-terminal domain-containing protein n=1 Tax=Brassica cretica TaxID=69181 RepID=A0A8S9STI1_BRACR|nr:hypothetical protein F2Q69_00034449 [Brassica cretica]
MDGGGGDGGGAAYNPHTVEEVYRDFKGRRNGMIKALTTDVQEFYRLCDTGGVKFRFLNIDFQNNVLLCEISFEKIEFALNQMNWPLKVVPLFPQLLGYSMEKRIVPRCNVIKALIAKGLLGSESPSIPCVLAYTNEAFLKRYVMKHDDKQLVT